MNERTFLELVSNDETAQRRLSAAAFAAFESVAADEELTTDEISQDQIRELADGFVERGLNDE